MAAAACVLSSVLLYASALDLPKRSRTVAAIGVHRRTSINTRTGQKLQRCSDGRRRNVHHLSESGCKLRTQRGAITACAEGDASKHVAGIHTTAQYNRHRPDAAAAPPAEAPGQAAEHEAKTTK